MSSPYEPSLEKNPKKGMEDELECEKTQESEREVNRASPNLKDYVLPFPFSSALKSAQEKPSDPCILDIFKETHITIPLIDTIQNIPSYSKFVKGSLHTL